MCCVVLWSEIVEIITPISHPLFMFMLRSWCLCVCVFPLVMCCVVLCLCMVLLRVRVRVRIGVWIDSIKSIRVDRRLVISFHGIAAMGNER